MMNNVTLMGRLTRDPELRKTPSGTSVASISIACDRDVKDADGNHATDFFELVAWRNTAEFVSKNFHKGSRIAVVGRLQNRSWTDKEGNKRTTTEIIVDTAYFADSAPKKSEDAE